MICCSEDKNSVYVVLVVHMHVQFIQREQDNAKTDLKNFSANSSAQAYAKLFKNLQCNIQIMIKHTLFVA